MGADVEAVSSMSAVSSAGASSSSGGRRTESITWMIPLDAIMSAVTTEASLTLTPSDKSIVTESPLRVGTSPELSDALLALADTT